MMNDHWKSDEAIVPKKLSNKGLGENRPTEKVEERASAKGNAKQKTGYWTQRQGSLKQDLIRIREAAKRNRKGKMTSLWHHVYRMDALWSAYKSLKSEVAPGVDKVTWREYGKSLEGNLKDLSDRLARGAYRAKPVERVYIPKADGRLRPIGKPALEDKIVQKATVEVLNSVYEVDFKGLSYGFRPKRSQHMALDALAIAIGDRKVNWILDADIKGFFDAITHEWLVKFVEHRIGDPRVIRHIKKWLKAGVLSDGRWEPSEKGTPQGGNISPILANIYLHYVLDLWLIEWRKRTRGEVIMVRFADDFVLGFQRKQDAERLLVDLKQRVAKFNLELHPEKTRLIEFGRWARKNRKTRGEGRPYSFDFLGFTHSCGTNRKGGFKLVRTTKIKSESRKLKDLKVKVRKKMHAPVPEVGRWLNQVLKGVYQYFGVPGNYEALSRFRYKVVWIWFRTLNRRSQKTSLTWDRMKKLALKYLSNPRITHPYPNERFYVKTRGKSPVR